MGKKYIHYSDVGLEIDKSLDLIDTLSEEIKKENKRVLYLEVLANYLAKDGFCPFTKKELLDNSIELQHFVTPILCWLDMKTKKQFRFESYGINADKLALILHDFIDFVCEFKGHKIGVGDALIRRFIMDKVEYYG